jgi:CubicO group peptidase (beta-lactamase class C family)
VHLIPPEDVGLSSLKLAHLSAAMQSYIDERKLAGMVTTLARHGQIFHFNCFGMMDMEAGKAMQPDAIFRIYSMTKPITGVAVMTLYEEGELALSDPVSKFIPEFKDMQVFAGLTDKGIQLADLKREVMIQDLLTHSSGLVYGEPEGSPVEVMVYEDDQKARKKTPDESLEEWIQRLVSLPLAYQPGTKWHYGLSFDVLGTIVQFVSGLGFDTYLKKKVFHPLQMVDTDFYVPEEKIDRLAAMYGPTEDGSLQLVDPPETSKFSKPRRYLSGGGGLVSTASDYMRFAQMLLHGGEWNGTRLLSQESVALMTTNHLTDDLLPVQLDPLTPYLRGHGFGFGVTVLTEPDQAGMEGSRGSYWWGGVANTFFWIDPKEELIGILMPQFAGGGYYPIQKEFQALTYQAILH